MENEQLNFSIDFDTLFKGIIPKHFLRYCLFSLSQNDMHHDIQRTFTTCKTGLEIFNHYQPLFNLTERDRVITMVACLMCDIGCRYGVKFHHLIGHGLVYEYIHHHWPNEFNEQEIAFIANAVLEHRSTSRYKPTSIIAELVSIADTGRPEINQAIYRAVTYRLTTPCDDITTKDDLVYEVHQFLIDKYGSVGYHWANYPELGKAYFKEEWNQFMQDLEQKDIILSIISNYYDMFFQSHWSVMK